MAQKRRFQWADLSEQPVDSSEFCLVPSCNDHAGCASGYDHGARKRHTSTISDRCVYGHSIDGLFRGHGFAGEGGFLGT